MHKYEILEAASRMINVVCGEPYGDGLTVTDIGIGYAEPGYHDDNTVWVLGDWNDKTRYENGERITTDNTPGRLAKALERIGVEIEWLDEWLRCSDCSRIFRCSGDSYSWQMNGTLVNECEPMCADCLKKDAADYVDEYINDSDRVITWLDSHELQEIGFQQFGETNESGWHPGQNANPEKILDEILEAHENAEVVFLMDEQSQFYVGFSAWFRIAETENDD